jgi:hypothetical protein
MKKGNLLLQGSSHCRTRSVISLTLSSRQHKKMIFRAMTILCFMATTVHSFSIPVADSIRLETAPLIGGPSWLPLHVKVVVDDLNVFDYIPLNATSTETLQNLLSLQAVPAEPRSKISSNIVASETTVYSKRAIQFCEDYTKDLHLIENNCWTFAFDLVRFILWSDR